MPNAASQQPSDSEVERRIMILANDLAIPAWQRVEKAYAKGATFAEAKQAVLEAELARLSGTTDDAILDRLIQLIMQTPPSALRPAARQRHRKIVLERLMQPYRESGGAEPGDPPALPGAMRHGRDGEGRGEEAEARRQIAAR